MVEKVGREEREEKQRKGKEYKENEGKGRKGKVKEKDNKEHLRPTTGLQGQMCRIRKKHLCYSGQSTYLGRRCNCKAQGFKKVQCDDDNKAVPHGKIPAISSTEEAHQSTVSRFLRVGAQQSAAHRKCTNGEPYVCGGNGMSGLQKPPFAKMLKCDNADAAMLKVHFCVRGCEKQRDCHCIACVNIALFSCGPSGPVSKPSTGEPFPEETVFATLTGMVNRFAHIDRQPQHRTGRPGTL
eukprot:1160724-Pelagomonas_calceolata.AAC.7